ncbi:MAG: helix-turn-helix transcriptional regulator [Rickettsiales bacterium]
MNAGELIQFTQSKANLFDSFIDPLRENFAIKNFGFLRVYNNLGYLYFTNIPELCKEYLTSISKSTIFCDKTLNLSGSKYRYLLWPETPSDNSMELYKNRGIWNGLTLLEESPDGDYVDLWWLASEIHNTNCRDFYLNNLKFVESLVDLFKRRHPDIFVGTDCNGKYNKFNFDNLSHSDMLKKMIVRKQSIIKEYFPQGVEAKGRNGLITFTSREIDCLLLLAYGKSTKEISRDLSISSRTVAAHVQSVRNKTGYMLRSDLVSLFHDQIAGFTI